MTPKPWEGATPGAPSTTPGPPGEGVQPDDVGVEGCDPQATPTGWEGATWGCGVVHALTAWLAGWTAATAEESSGPMIHPEGSTTAPGVLALMGRGTLDGAPQSEADARGVVQLVATVGVDGAGLGLPQADAGAEVTVGVGATVGAGATAGVGTTATTGAVVAADLVRERVVELRRDVLRVGVPDMGIMGAAAGSATGARATG